MKRTFLVLPLSLLGGCDACDRPKPYVPYAIDAAPSDAAEPTSTKPTSSAPPTEGLQVEIASHLAARWKLGGAERLAPAGRTFTAGVGLSSGGALALVRESPNDPGELLFFARSNEQGEVILNSASVTREGCEGKSSLTASGQTLLVELGCARRVKSAQGAISRVVGVVKVIDRPAVRASFAVLDPSETPGLAFRATSPDIDHDGVGDLVFDVTLGGAVAPFEPTSAQFEPTSAQSIQLRWFDRPAGLSRDLDAAADPFAVAVKAVSAKVAQGKDLSSAMAEATHISNLARSFCPEFGALRVRRVAGDRFECGSSKSLGELPLLLVRAALGRKELLRAAILLDDVDQAAKLKDIEATFSKLAKSVSAKLERRLQAIPMLPVAGGPSVGPVQFVDDTTLLVRTGAGVVRALLTTGEEAAADGIAAWPDLALSPNGKWRWTTLGDPCDGSPVRATFADATGQTQTVSLPLVGRLQSSCPQTGVSVRGSPLSWTSEGLVAFMGGEVVSVLPNLDRAILVSPKGVAEPLKGSSASADGKSVVWPTRFGFVVTGEAPRLFKPDVQVKSRWCTVNPGRTRVACVVGSAVEVYLAVDKKVDDR